MNDQKQTVTSQFDRQPTNELGGKKTFDLEVIAFIARSSCCRESGCFGGGLRSLSIFLFTV